MTVERKYMLTAQRVGDSLTRAAERVRVRFTGRHRLPPTARANVDRTLTKAQTRPQRKHRSHQTHPSPYLLGSEMNPELSNNLRESRRTELWSLEPETPAMLAHVAGRRDFVVITFA